MKKTQTIAAIALFSLIILFFIGTAMADQGIQVAMQDVQIKKVASPGVSFPNVSVKNEENKTLLHVRLKPTRSRLPEGDLHLVVQNDQGDLLYYTSVEVARHRAIRGKKANDTRVTVSLPLALQPNHTLILSYGEGSPGLEKVEKPESSAPSSMEERVFEIIPQKGGVII